MKLPMRIQILPFLCYFFPSLLFSQYYQESGYTAISSQKQVTDYFDNVDDKSFYQSQRIHGMKNEINSYSERLHKLQSRFDEIFYGLSRGGSFKKPFDTNQAPSRPSKSDLYVPAPATSSQANSNLYPSGALIDDSSDLFAEPEGNSANQLAFQVEAPGTYTADGRTKSLFDPREQGQNNLGKYFLLTPGFAIPYKIHRPSTPLVNNERYTRYRPGVSVVLAGGFEKNNFRFGLGGMYKRHQHHDSSWEYHSAYTTPRNRLEFEEVAETFAGFLDLGYEFNMFGGFDGFFGVGLGYYLSIVKDPRRRLDHGFFATGNIGVAYNFNEMIALRLGYRYFLEKEVPAHAAELGLDFEF